MPSKTVVLFNHKGGVSKTTTTFNLAWMVAEMGKRVLLVDGDPQCNLTYLLLGAQFDRFYEEDRTKNNNLYDAVKNAFEGKPKPIESIECINPGENRNLFLIPGHPNLSEYDPALSFALNSNNVIATLQNLPGAFAELVRLSEERYGIEYVFIDMNPGLSSINQTLFMMADYFIVPTNPDPFSIMAMKTLKTVLPRWKNWSINARGFFADATYPLPSKEMKFVGEIIQRFTIRKGVAARPYQGRIDEIKEYVETQLVPELQKSNMVYDITQFITEKRLVNHCIAEISEFGALLQKTHELNIPVFAIRDEQIKETGSIRDQLVEKRQQVRDIFHNIALLILGL
jgi:chromosome partitioning protein